MPGVKTRGDTCFFKISNARFASISQTDDSAQNFKISLREFQFGKSNFTQEKNLQNSICCTA
jgi:hypothetical protein